MTRFRHGTIEVERRFRGPLSRLYQAWTDDEALARWCCPGDAGWSATVLQHDLAVGGIKRLTFGPAGEPPYEEVTRYLSIAPHEHLVCAETILRGAAVVSCSLITLAFAEAANGSHLDVTDQITLFDNRDTPDARRAGWGEVMARLEIEVGD